MAESRKHGPFDHRYPVIAHEPRPPSLWVVGEERADWNGFVARFYPGSRRHDFNALGAYESYRDDVGALPLGTNAALSDPEIERWEAEGGARGRGVGALP